MNNDKVIISVLSTGVLGCAELGRSLEQAVNGLGVVQSFGIGQVATLG